MSAYLLLKNATCNLQESFDLGENMRGSPEVSVPAIILAIVIIVVVLVIWFRAVVHAIRTPSKHILLKILKVIFAFFFPFIYAGFQLPPVFKNSRGLI